MSPTSPVRRKHRLSTRIMRALATHKRTIAIAGAVIAVGLGGGIYYLTTSNTPEAHMARAIAAEQRGDLAAAAIELKNTLQAAPNNHDARFLLGRIHFTNGDYAAAEKEFRKALELGFRGAELLPLLGRTLLALNQPQPLLDEIRVAEGAPPDSNAAILALRARAHFLLEDSVSAEKALSEADALLPEHPETLIARALQAVGGKQPEEALAIIDKALAKAGKRADLWIIRGDLLRLLNRNEEALAAFGNALKLEPANIPAWLATAQVHMRAGNLDQAQSALRELQKNSPNNVYGKYLQAFVDFRHARYQDANTKLQELFRIAPGFLPAHLLGGAVNLGIGNREAAKSHLNKVLEAAPNHPLARKLMAATLTDQGDIEQAKKILGSFDTEGKDPVLSTLRGGIALREGNYAEARKQLENMGEEAQQHPRYFTDLAASRMGSGDEAGAIEALSKAAELDTASARPDVLLVLSHLRAKRFAEALAVVDQLEKERPNDPLIHNLRGTIHIARNDRVQARTHFSKALQVKPDFFPAASNLALLDMTDKDTKAARSRFEQLLKHAPKESRAWLALAALDAREKDEAGYLANLEKAKQADNKNVQVHLLLARYWLQKQDGGKALSAAREGLNSTGRQEFQEWVGLSQLLLNDHANAAGTFSRWAESNPNNPMAYFRLAQAQMRGNDNKAALQSLDKALALRADFPDASLNKAMILTRLGRSTEAIKIARSVQASAPKAVSGYLLEADILSHDKKHTEAAKLYAKSAQLSGRGQLLGRAYQAYISAGQPQEGEKLLEQWLRDHPKDLAARHELARGQLQINRLREASENYRVLIRANPQDLVAYNNLAWALGELKAPDALGIAEQALKLAPQNAAVLDTYGWQLTQAGQAKRGLPYLRDALNRNPDNPDIRWHLAVALEKTGDREAAIVELDRLLASRAQFSHESQARDLLARLKGTAR